MDNVIEIQDQMRDGLGRLVTKVTRRTLPDMGPKILGMVHSTSGVIVTVWNNDGTALLDDSKQDLFPLNG